MSAALLAAITAHMALIGLKIERQPESRPELSLPRAVHVFLGQKSTRQPSVDRAANKPSKEQLEVKKTAPDAKAAKPAGPETNRVEITKSPDKTLLPPQNSQKPLEEKGERTRPTALQEEAAVPRQSAAGPESIPQESAGVSAPLQPAVKPGQDAASPTAEGVPQPGTLHKAYPRYRLNGPPGYPRLARKRGQEGTVVLQVLVNPNGLVDDLEVEVSSGFRLLDRAALAAVKKWRFEPGRLGEEKLTMWVKVPVTFRLQEK